MDKTNEIIHPVNITTEHEQYVVSKKAYLVIAIIRFIVHGVIGVFLSCMLYNQMHCTDCNIVVVIFFSIISLGCFANMGLPIDKLANIKLG